MEKVELQPLLIVKQNTVLSEAFDVMESVSKANKERYQFIKKQIEGMKAEDDKSEKEFWKVVEKELGDAGPFTLKDGVIYKGDDRSNNGLHGLLSAIFGRQQ